jgi:thioredoxin-dependent peroxiredoxin
VLGISVDTPAENLAFKKQNGFQFPLLCDVTREVSMLYGACNFKEAFYTNRISYLIGPDGIIQKAFPEVSAANHADEVLALL